MKKRTFWTYLGRGLIALIFILIISFVGIFVFDRYSPVNASKVESDDYWVKLDGFKSYGELLADENKYNILSSEYVSPFYKEDGTPMTTYEKIQTARYTEEMDYVIKPLSDRITAINVELNTITSIYEKPINDWIFEMMGINYIYKEASSPFAALAQQSYKGTEKEFEEMVLDYKNNNIYKQIFADGFADSFTSFVQILVDASGTGSKSLYELAVKNGYKPIDENDEEVSRKQWIIDVAGFSNYQVESGFSAYDFVTGSGYTGSLSDWSAMMKAPTGEAYYTVVNNGFVDYFSYNETDYNFFMALYNDEGKVKNDIIVLDSAYTIATTEDVDTKNILEKEKNELQELLTEADRVKAEKNLGNWNDYFSRYQLIMETNETDPNSGYRFYMNMALTTFKVVDKSTGYEWYSNPQKIDNPDLKASQSNIISVFYGETGGALNEFSNYNYSTSTTEKNTTVTPNFAVKIDKDNKMVQVWYHMESRSINYTSIPQYISVDRVEELFERNKEIASVGRYDSTGTKIIDIETATENYNLYYASNTTKIADLRKQLANSSLSQSQKEEIEEQIRTLEAQNREYKRGYDIYSSWFGSWYQRIGVDNTTSLQKYPYWEYNAGKYEFMSAIVLKNMHNWLYEWCGYTNADLADDNEAFGISIDNDRVAFEIGIQYQLTDDGLQVTIPSNSIREFGDHTICNVDILPYFTSTPKDLENPGLIVDGNLTKGYTIIPDGSGSIMEHDNGKSNAYEPYIKRLYTTDLSQTSVVKKPASYDIMLPMYAVVNGDSAVIVDAVSMASQLEIHATTSGYGSKGESNNTNYFRAYLRESQDVFIGTYSKEAVRKFTNGRLMDDIVIDYNFIGRPGSSLDYSDIAKIYRDKIIKKYYGNKETSEIYKDTTTSPVLDMDVIGSYTYTDNFLGISYTAKGTMTTYKELSTILDTFQDELKIQYINVFYKGWRKEALVDVSFKKIQLNSLLGSKKELKALVEKHDDVTIYPYVSMGQINDYQESFGENHYTSRDVIGEIITNYPYDVSTNTYDNKGRKISVLSPHYYYSFSKSLVKSFVKTFGIDSNNKKNTGINSISINYFGSSLSGDYKKNSEMFKTDAIKEQIKSLDLISQSIDNINLYQPYDYAFAYISHAREIPYQSSQKELLDYSIPFYQLVVNGLFDYSGESINANIEDGVDFHIMKLIETGANPQFTFTYDSSAELINTDYNDNYNTEYKNWISTIQNIYNQLDRLDGVLDGKFGIYECRLVKHEKLSPNIYQVTYHNDLTNEDITIVLNYSFAKYHVDKYNVDVPAKSYKVL